ncbi:MAG: sulfatase-like hydrolase/transferase, partial [Planctomycetaceae bacterium]|nr:sulfatase-like hydrolase/transferase [Planctomycetaceae bacterium]
MPNRIAAVTSILLMISHTGIPFPAANAAETIPIPVNAPRPNIVLIFSDDQGINDVSCYGSEIPTPHIDQIGKQGVRFTNWYSASSICTPSRYGLLTGRNPCRSEDRLLSALMFLTEEDGRRGLRPHETTIAEVLRRAGYSTALIGKWHLGHGTPEFLPTHHGFDTFKGFTGGCIDYFTMTYGVIPDWYEGTTHVSRNGYSTELITDEAVKWLESQKNSGQPFFLYLPYNAPHFGKGWNPSKKETVNIMQAQGNDLQRVNFIDDKIRREFAAMVVSLDDGVGRIMRALDEYELSDNTLLIFLTDHGGDPVYGGSNLPLRGDKATLFDGGLKVPCVMRWPGRIQPRRTSNQLTSSLDLFPTICHLAGIEPSEPAEAHLDGVDLSDHLLQQSPVPRRELYWETGQHAELDRGNWIALRSGPLKYVRSADGDEFLFDVERDPGEQNNLKDLQPQDFDRMRTRSVRLSMLMSPAVAGVDQPITERQLQLQEYALANQGDPDAGRQLFEQNDQVACATCHRITGMEKSGPNLDGIGDKYTRAELIRHILQPSAEIKPGYQQTVILKNDGLILTGRIERATQLEVRLIDTKGNQTPVARSDIDEMTHPAISLMPDNVADRLKQGEFTDLIAYLETLKFGLKSGLTR